MHSPAESIIRDLRGSSELVLDHLEDLWQLQHLSTALIANGDMTELLTEILRSAMRMNGAEAGILQLFDSASGELTLHTVFGLDEDFQNRFAVVDRNTDSPCGNTLRTGSRTIVSNFNHPDLAGTPAVSQLLHAGLQAACATPLHCRLGRLKGIFTLLWSQPTQPSARKLHLLDILARQAADLIEREQSRVSLHQSEERYKRLSRSLEKKVATRTAELDESSERLKALMAQLLVSEHENRQHLSKVLHDGLQQILVAATLHVPYEPENTELARLRELLQLATEACRTLCFDLSPPWFRERDLRQALHWLAAWFQENHQRRVSLKIQNRFPTISADIKLFLFESIRELLLNAVKHSGPGDLSVALTFSPSAIQAEVADQGRGFAPESSDRSSKSGGGGLDQIKERAEALGGQLEIFSGVADGSRLVLTLPRR